jgi:RNA polymerase sigma-70 factor (ECF subfamily)
LFVDEMRHRAREVSHLSSAAPGADTLADPASTAQEPALSVRELDRALAQLSHEQRETVLLVGLEGFRYAEVARMTGVPVGTVMSRLSRGRERLRRLMEGEDASGHGPALRRVR